MEVDPHTYAPRVDGQFLTCDPASALPLAQRFFGLVEGLNLEKVSPSQWTRLNLIWVLFFVVAGLLNIYVAYNYSENTWATFKVFGLMAFTFVFMVAQTFWIANIIGDEDEEPEH